VTSAGITTERLRGERPRRDHAALYAQLFGSDAVAATLWPPPHGGARSPQQAHELLGQDVAHWDSEGFGPWLFFEAATGRFAGHAGLRRGTVGGAPSVEVLYAVRHDRWGRGYASEMALAAVDRARAIGLTGVVGYTLTTNHASQRVLEKAGLRFERTLEHAGLPHWFGRLSFARAA
jgi:ribosomal-protein-alanine N-acetyltransferase